MDAEGNRYIGYSMIRESYKGESKRVLFFLHDETGSTTLAITGIDSRGTGHFVYESEAGLTPQLKCTNRAGAIAWLADLGVTHVVDKSTNCVIPGGRRPALRTPVRPRLDRVYVDHHKEDINDGIVSHENFYLVDSAGEEVLAVLGSTVDDYCVYRCVVAGQNVNFKDKMEVVGWLDWVVGKTDMPPSRLMQKDSKKGTRTRDQSKAKAKGSSTSKSKMTNLSIEDMRGIFGDADLARWVLRKPNPEEVKIFKQWKETLSENEGQSNDQSSDAEALKILQSLQKHDTCLKLLEETSVARPISSLASHPDKRISELASDISLKWNEWTNQALAKASAARHT